MKFSLIAAIVLLALAQGSFAQDVADLDRLGQHFEELKNKMTMELAELLRNQELTNQAQTFLEDKKTQLEPIVAQVQEQLRTAATNMEEQIKPLAASVQAQVQPMVDNFKAQMEALLQRMVENARAIGN